MSIGINKRTGKLKKGWRYNKAGKVVKAKPKKKVVKRKVVKRKK